MEDSFRLGVSIYNSGFKPSFIVGLWRGGSTVGIYVQECLQTLGVKTDHMAVRTSYEGALSYDDMVRNPNDRIRVHGTQYLFDSLNQDDRLLIVDDVYSSGYNVQAVVKELQAGLRKNMPVEVKIAALWYKPDKKRVEAAPDYYYDTTDKWLVLPYELTGLSREEIKQHKPAVWAQLNKPS